VRNQTPNRASSPGQRRASPRGETSTSGHRVGDKIRIKSGAHAGTRAVVDRVTRDLLITLVNGADPLMVPAQDVTNYSLAARRAWEVMPKRAGRPKKTGSAKRMVSIRIDQEVWDGLAAMVRLGVIPSREGAVNTWLQSHLSSLRALSRGRAQVSTKPALARDGQRGRGHGPSD
jgi:hypothetical protein